MDERIRQCRFSMDGSWTPSELAGLLMSAVDLYNLRLVLEVMREDSTAFEEFYFEMRHMPPFRTWRRRSPLAMSSLFSFMAGSTPPLPLDREHLSRMARMVYPGEQMTVRRVSYASPGFTDLAGVGTIVGHVKDFTIHVIDLWVNREQRRLSNETAELENEARRIQNARSFVALSAELGYSQSETRALVGYVDERQHVLGGLAEAQKLIGAGEPEGE